MENKALLAQYTALCMELQEEYLKRPQDFDKQRAMENEFKEMKHEILRRMGD